MADKTEATIMIDAVPEEVMAEIADFESYTEWSNEIKEAKIVSRDAKKRGKKVFFSLDAGVAKAKYTLEYGFLPGDRGVTWTTVEAEGAIRDLTGEYVLEADGDGRTKVTYRMSMDLAIPLPGFLKRQGEKKVIDVALKGLKKRVESRA